MTPADILLINRLADAAGQAIRPFFRSAYSHEAKADASPVTEADRAAESSIRRVGDGVSTSATPLAAVPSEAMAAGPPKSCRIMPMWPPLRDVRPR